MMVDLRILIIGGTGFLGANLVEYFLTEGHSVAVLARHANNLRYIQGRVTFIKCALADVSHWDELLDGYDWVFHLASESRPSDSNCVMDVKETILPTLYFLDSCVRKKIRKVVFFSSGGTVYGSQEYTPIAEAACLNPISSYGIHKLVLEKYFSYYRYMYNLPVYILRISNPYGKFQQPFRSQGLISNILGRYYTNQVIEIWGSGEAVRDYIEIHDVMRAVGCLLSYDGSEYIFNIGSGKGYTTIEIIETVEKCLGKQLQKTQLPARKQDVSVNILDITRAERLLHWHAEVGLEQGICKMMGLWNQEEERFVGHAVIHSVEGESL